MRLLLLTSVLVVATNAGTEIPLKQFVYKTKFGEQLPYQAVMPDKPEGRLPVVLFLHGAGERGTDNRKQTLHVVPELLAYLASIQQQAIVLAPQCPPREQWVNVPWGAKSHTMPEFPATSLRLALELLAETVATQPVDPDRIYLVGLSMGGYGTWDAIQRKPGYFAAAVPICGGGDVNQAVKLKNLPIWAWHGDRDTVVPTSRSRDMIAAIKAAGGKPSYNELAGVGHNAWKPAADHQPLWQWLFAQKR